MFNSSHSNKKYLATWCLHQCTVINTQKIIIHLATSNVNFPYVTIQQHLFCRALKTVDVVDEKQQKNGRRFSSQRRTRLRTSFQSCGNSSSPLSTGNISAPPCRCAAAAAVALFCLSSPSSWGVYHDFLQVIHVVFYVWRVTAYQVPLVWRGSVALALLPLRSSPTIRGRCTEWVPPNRRKKGSRSSAPTIHQGSADHY